MDRGAPASSAGSTGSVRPQARATPAEEAPMHLNDARRIMMISTHGYVSAEAEMGKPDTGGQVVYVLKLSEYLSRLGYDVDIFTRRFEDQPAIEQVSPRVRIVRIEAGGPDFIRKEVMCDAIPEWVRNARAFIDSQDLRYDFIDSHYWDAGLAGDALSTLLAIPHIHTPHSIGSWKRDNMDGDAVRLDEMYNFKRRIRDEKAIFDAAEVLVATTPQQRDILMASEYDVPREKIAVIPPGYDDTTFFPVSNASRSGLKRDLGLEDPVVLAVGRIAANKGYDLLIRSFPVVKARIPEARLMLAIGSTEPTAGEIRQVDELRAIAAELGLGDSVIFHDFIPDDQLADHYRAADVFALCSRYEPFGMTAVEAMACGTPTVVTTEGGLWEMITWGLDALYADPFDTEAFGHALATVLEFPRVSAQLARGGSHRARARFTWTGIAQQVLNVISSVDDPTDEALDPADDVEPLRRGPRSVMDPAAVAAANQESEWAHSGSW
jgi:mannosylfructose-phosphate synthase